ncbi:MerR family transcriptional regulator [Rossellomorea marisflavi]|uniref:MerR family transcriptional regulator n=1 Tax=Rossellomorea marisflavi TaxID=189381 RepID=A0A0M0G669_9BACI|nr:MerR family transcriptional regulator [Rossellomorea marisflavi]KON85370.1 MerR family transcriptional regulator [Rossellomorea marisflavi]
MLHINEVKKMSGVSVRTLRYYDQIGLLIPAGKTDGGHRLYTSAELKKLQQIQFLKSIGFQLAEIGEILESKEWDWAESLKKQLSYVLNEKDRLSDIEKSLRELMNGLAIDGEEFQISKIMSLYARGKKDSLLKSRDDWDVHDERVLERLPNMNSTDPDSLEWIALLGQLKKYMDLGPSHPRIQGIIRRMDEKRTLDFDGEDAFLDQLWEIRMCPEKSEEHRLYPVDQEVLKLMAEAYDLYLEETDGN